MNTSNGEKLVQLQRQSTLNAIRTHSRHGEFKLDVLESEQAVLAHWLSLIIVSSPQTRIIFKSHFMLKDAKQLAAALYGLAPDQLSMDRATDFFREFCNLV